MEPDLGQLLGNAAAAAVRLKRAFESGPRLRMRRTGGDTPSVRFERVTTLSTLGKKFEARALETRPAASAHAKLERAAARLAAAHALEAFAAALLQREGLRMACVHPNATEERFNLNLSHPGNPVPRVGLAFVFKGVAVHVAVECGAIIWNFAHTPPTLRHTCEAIGKVNGEDDSTNRLLANVPAFRRSGMVQGAPAVWANLAPLCSDKDTTLWGFEANSDDDIPFPDASADLRARIAAEWDALEDAGQTLGIPLDGVKLAWMLRHGKVHVHQVPAHWDTPADGPTAAEPFLATHPLLASFVGRVSSFLSELVRALPVLEGGNGAPEPWISAIPAARGNGFAAFQIGALGSRWHTPSSLAPLAGIPGGGQPWIATAPHQSELVAAFCTPTAQDALRVVQFARTGASRATLWRQA